MRYGIFSDVHANLEALEAVAKSLKAEQIDRYFCIGDLVGYGANPNECVDKVRSLAALSVAGNHDWASVNLFSMKYFNPEAADAILWTRQRLNPESTNFLEALKLIFLNEDFTLAHGTLDNPQEFNYLLDGFSAWETFQLLKTKVCFIGHTHIPLVFIKDKSDEVYIEKDDIINLAEDKTYIINAGSVGQPRDGNPQASYCIFDTQDKEVRIKRVSYDFKKARKKIIDAGLPKFLGDRLLSGK